VAQTTDHFVWLAEALGIVTGDTDSGKIAKLSPVTATVRPTVALNAGNAGNDSERLRYGISVTDYSLLITVTGVTGPTFHCD
jgi:hypothetical protein